MPRGRSRGGGGHKGQRRHFSNPDQLEESKEKKERERRWRQQRGELSSDEDEENSGASGDSASESSEEEAGEEEQAKAKGVQHLIEVENPNRVIKKEKKKEPSVGVVGVAAANSSEAQPQLTRREREELEKQRAKAHYMKMHAAGKTAEARADLARLAIIKQQREDAAKKRELEIQAKKDADLAKAEQTKKALGKKT